MYGKTLETLRAAASKVLCAHLLRFVQLSDERKLQLLAVTTPLSLVTPPELPAKPAAKTTGRVIEFYIPKNYRPKPKAGSTDGGEIFA